MLWKRFHSSRFVGNDTFQWISSIPKEGLPFYICDSMCGQANYYVSVNLYDFIPIVGENLHDEWYISYDEIHTFGKDIEYSSINNLVAKLIILSEDKL